jgi:uncharacterized protein YmfQ (DUF2313 family)
MSDQWVQRTAVEYAEAFNNLLPQGAAWPRNSDAVLQMVVSGLSGIWGDPVETLAALLLNVESDPRQTNVLLPGWERNFGLPDSCLPFPPTTISGRQAALVARMTKQGAQSRDFFTAEAAALGQNINIREFAPYMCGVSRCGDTRTTLYGSDSTHFRWQLGPEELRFHWTVDLTHVLTGVECMFRREKPAQTDVHFTYNTTLDRADAVYTFLGY